MTLQDASLKRLSWVYSIIPIITAIVPIWMWLQVRLAGQTFGGFPGPYLFFQSSDIAALLAISSIISVVFLTLRPTIFAPQRYKASLIGTTLFNLLLFPFMALSDFLVWVLVYDHPHSLFKLSWCARIFFRF